MYAKFRQHDPQQLQACVVDAIVVSSSSNRIYFLYVIAELRVREALAKTIRAGMGKSIKEECLSNPEWRFPVPFKWQVRHHR